jgi:hypothetical protein
MVAIALLCCDTGCTMNSLSRDTFHQTKTAVDLRFQEMMEDFAIIANEKSALPVYASIYAGTIITTDTAQVSAQTVLQNVTGGRQNGFGSQNLNPQLSRQTAQAWTVDAIIDPEKLEAMRCAFQWVLYGRAAVADDCISLLARPDQVPHAPGRHFGVLDDLNRLPTGWLCQGRLKDVPIHAKYKAHCGARWVWVAQDGVKGLADFALIIQNIARVNINSTTLFNPGLIPYSLTLTPPDKPGFLDLDVINAEAGVRIVYIGSDALKDNLHVGDVICQVNTESVTDVTGFRKQIGKYAGNKVQLVVQTGDQNPRQVAVFVGMLSKMRVIVAVDANGRLAPDAPYYRIRTDSLGTDPYFRSQISAVSATK